MSIKKVFEFIFNRLNGILLFSLVLCFHIFTIPINAAVPLSKTKSIIKITVPSGAKSHLTWSPNGKSLGFLNSSKGKTHLIIGRINKEPVDFGVASFFTWAPDGDSLAIVRDLEGSNTIILSSYPGQITQKITKGDKPAFSRDGSTLAFLRDNKIFSISLKSGKEHQLTRKGMVAIQLQGSINGFIFTADGCLWSSSTNKTPKMIMRNAGMGTGCGLEYYINLVLSPKKDKVLIVSSGRQDAVGVPSSLLLVDTNGKNKKTIGLGQEPSWSPNNRCFVYSLRGNLWIYRLKRADSKELTKQRSAGYRFPSWSPDGKHIAFIATLADTTGDGKIDWRDKPSVFVMDAPSD